MKQIFTLFFVFALLYSNAQTTADFESYSLDSESFFNGSNANGSFADGNILLPNFYNAMWDSWTGFAISNMTDVTTPGFMNQYSAITGGGYNNSINFAVGFISGPTVMHLQNDAIGEVVNGFHITNSTYAFLSMRDGDQFAKKFGGATGDDPDFYFLTIKGFQNGALTADSVDFYLADFRSTDNTEDFIIDEWTFVDLTSLGAVDSLQFTVSSSDVGQFGINTPTYFCMDNFITSDGTVSADDIFEENLFDIYPNPTSDFIFIENNNTEEFEVSVFDLFGKRIYNDVFSNSHEQINLAGLANGVYLVEIRNGERRGTKRIVKK